MIPTLYQSPPDSAYDPNTHTYRWEIGTVLPDAIDCFDIEVVVNETAAPGISIHNIAEIWEGEVFVNRAHEYTPIECWDTVDPNIIYVDINADGYDNGTDWENAYSGPDGLQKAITRASDSVCTGPFTVYVAQGIYSPGVRDSDSFELPDDVEVYGGFRTGGSAFNERVPRYCPTVLTGDIDPNLYDTDIEYVQNETIVTMGDNTLLDGFTVTKASDYGIYGDGVDFTVENCRIKNNEQWGIYAKDGNAEILWCEIIYCGADGILHEGENCILVVENCRVMRNLQHGVYCIYSTPRIINSIVSESDLTGYGREGIRMINPSSTPELYNNTIAHNKAAGIYFRDDSPKDYPDVQNCIMWYNNNNSDQHLGLDRSLIQYCCIYDPNNPNKDDYTLDANFNFSGKPVFAYIDPNNVHLNYDSPCKDAGNPYLTYTGQVDMDETCRVVGYTADIGADEVDCEDTDNKYDWSADGIINYEEFSKFSIAWLSHDPNDPSWFADPNIADPNLSEDWYDWKYKCNLDDTGDSQYQIDMADLMEFITDSWWLWTACWRDDLIMMQSQQMAYMPMEMSIETATPMLLSSTDSLGFTSKSVPYADIPDSELAPMVVNIYSIMEHFEDIVAENPHYWDEYADIKEFLEGILQDMRASRQ